MYIPTLESDVGIYSFRNLATNHVYVGSSWELKTRLKFHIWALKKGVHENLHFQRAFCKYGEVVFVIEILAYCSVFELSLKEEFWITVLDAANSKRGYNYEFFVQGRPLLNQVARRRRADAVAKSWKLADERKARQSLMNCTEEHRLKVKHGQLVAWCGSTGKLRRQAMSYARSKQVYRFALDGQYFDCFPSLVHANKVLGVDISSVSQVCTGKMRTAGGFLWSYQPYLSQAQVAWVEKTEGGKKGLSFSSESKVRRKALYAGRTISDYQKSAISLAITGKVRTPLKVAYTQPISPTYVVGKRGRPGIWQFTLDGVLVGEYKSLIEASEIGGCCSTISAVLHRKGKTAHGFFWRYARHPVTVLRGSL